MTTTYHHQPLPITKSTRLITLLPSSSISDPVEIELSETDLSDGPRYEALSYAWGDPSHTVAISCHGRDLTITVNCESALRHLRRTSRSRILWVDAISIDQTSIDERNRQVRIMGDIYSQASTVLIWLGPATQFTSPAFQFLAAFEHLMTRNEDDQKAGVQEAYQVLGAIRAMLGDTIDIFAGIHQSPWFERVWTLQEVALAKHPLVICGDRSLSWNVLVFAVDRLRLAENKTAKYDYLSMFDARIAGHQITNQAVSRLPNLSKSLNVGLEIPISTILTTSLRKNAGHSEDRIFGVHAILKRLGVALPDPDYGRPVDQLFVEASRAAIEHDNSLWILDYVHGLEVKPNWPSWVPTWTDKFTPAPVETNAFQAAGSSQPTYRFSADGLSLTVRAKVIDSIMVRTQRVPFADVPNRPDMAQMAVLSAKEIENTIKAYQEWNSLFATLSMFAMAGPSNRYGDRGEHTQAFVRVLLQDMTMVPDSFSHTYDLFTGYHTWQRYLSAKNPRSLCPMPQIEALIEGYDSKPKWLPESLHYLTQTDEWKIYEAIERDPKASLFENHVTLSIRARVFFMTETGYYGSAPSSARPGDQIILVSGLHMPLVVRQVGDEHTLIGPAFVQGMMGGECWPSAVDDLRDLTLV